MPQDDLQVQEPKQESTTQPPAGGQLEQPAQPQASAGFSQEQVNTFTGKAREEGRNSATKELLNKLGAESLDKVLEVFQQHKKAEEEKLSEVDRLKKEIVDTQAKRDALEKENQTLKIKGEFASTVSGLNLEFVNEHAAADAFTKIDLAQVADKGMKVMVQELHATYSYLFKSAPAPETDATKRTKTNSGTLTDDQKEEIRKKYRLK